MRDELLCRILQFCAEYPSGLPDFELQRLTPNIEALQRAAVINGLLAKVKGFCVTLLISQQHFDLVLG